jgi:hypothetical protein
MLSHNVRTNNHTSALSQDGVFCQGDHLSCFVKAALGGSGPHMLSAVIGGMTSANKIIVNEAQRRRKYFLITDEAAVKFGLHPIVSPALLAEGREFQKGCKECQQRARELEKVTEYVRASCHHHGVPLKYGLSSMHIVAPQRSDVQCRVAWEPCC